MLLQVEVLHRPVADLPRRVVELRFVQVALALFDALIEGRAHEAPRLVEQVHEPHRVARARREGLHFTRLGVLLADHPEADVLEAPLENRLPAPFHELHGLALLRGRRRLGHVQPAGAARRLEAHVEVLRLALVRDVHDPVHVHFLDAVPDRRHVRRVVPEAAVRLLQEEWPAPPVRQLPIVLLGRREVTVLARDPAGGRR